MNNAARTPANIRHSDRTPDLTDADIDVINATIALSELAEHCLGAMMQDDIGQTSRYRLINCYLITIEGHCQVARRAMRNAESAAGRMPL